MRNCFILAVTMVSLVVSNAHAEQESLPVAHYEPVLRESTNAELCGAFASAWAKVFRGEKSLSVKWLDLKAVLPEAEVVSFGGFYNRSHHHTLDLDGDGEKEVLHFESHDVGWRYLGVNLYLFETEADYLRARASFQQQERGEYLFVEELEEPANPAPKKLSSFPATSVIFLLSFNGAIYVTAAPRKVGRGGTLTASLDRLDGQGRLQSTCLLELLPSYEAFQAFSEESELFQALISVYGGSDGRCLGTMGWTAPSAYSHLPTLFHRPWAMSDIYGRPVPNSKGEDAAREIRLLVWGLSDPISWSVYRQLKKRRPEFVRQMTNYYRQYFAMAPGAAQKLAERAYRFLVDRIVYARNPDSHRLTRVAADDLEIGVDSAPEAIADVAIERWLQSRSVARSKPSYGDETTWRDAILAALYTRQSIVRTGTLWAKLEAELALQIAAWDTESRRAYVASQRTTYMNEMLLAALGDQGLTELVVTFGVDVDAPTNWFRKTPLMYAAQNDDFAAVRFLLGRGANPSSQTSDSDAPCDALERDERTPLMYAAENGSPEVTRELLKAGADVAAADSQGNTALWYLDRNPHLSETERVPLRLLLRPVK